MNKLSWQQAIVIIFFIYLCIFPVSFYGLKPRVLILHSYATDYSWVNDVNKGIDEVIGKKPFSVKYYYLDTKKRPDTGYMTNAGIAARNLINKWKPDVIIAVDDEAQMLDDHNDYKMSVNCQHFLAGMLLVAPELMCFYAPYVNSYKRYGSSYVTPCNLSWGLDNRTVAFRLVGREKAFRIENRIPGADANPYLVFAACLASGLYGIENRLTLSSPPVCGNAYEMPELEKLPASLMAALTIFENSKIARDLFGEDVIEHYAKTAQTEIDHFLASVTDWERRRNFEQV